MSSEDGVWPWGEGRHVTLTRTWCECGENCYDPAEEAREMMRPDDAYWMLCRCCREPLYQLRIAELEGELARFHKCKGFEAVFLESVGKNGIRECRKAIWHKEQDT